MCTRNCLIGLRVSLGLLFAPACVGSRVCLRYLQVRDHICRSDNQQRIRKYWLKSQATHRIQYIHVWVHVAKIVSGTGGWLRRITASSLLYIHMKIQLNTCCIRELEVAALELAIL